jgi:hypothetical protein
MGRKIGLRLIKSQEHVEITRVDPLNDRCKDLLRRSCGPAVPRSRVSESTSLTSLVIGRLQLCRR